VLNKQIIK